jgi:hypothetical protein
LFGWNRYPGTFPDLATYNDPDPGGWGNCNGDRYHHADFDAYPRPDIDAYCCTYPVHIYKGSGSTRI